MNDIEKQLLKINAEKTALQSELSDGKEYGDWKIAKCYECSLMNQEAPYAITELHEKRQKARNRINELESLEAELNTKKQDKTH